MTTTTEPTIVRDMPLGRDGRRGRLLYISADEHGRHRLLLYRGTNEAARRRVARAAAAELRELHERSPDVERRAGVHEDLEAAVATAIDMPLFDQEVRSLTAYLEALQ